MLKKYNKAVTEKIFFVHGQEKGAAFCSKRKIYFVVWSIILFLVVIALLLRGSSVGFCATYFVVGSVGFYATFDSMVFKKAKNRCLQMRLELAAVLDRIAVLLDAGVTLWNAVVIVSQGGDVGGGAFEDELRKTVNSFCGREGYYFEPEAAFEEMAARCADVTVSTFVSLIVQNSRKGTEELAELLRMQAINARNERRVLAKQLSDEASTLMLIPSVIVLAAILVLVAAPAVIQFL